MTVSSTGNFLVTASHDKSIRVWEKTKEIVVLDEEREMVRHYPLKAELYTFYLNGMSKRHFCFLRSQWFSTNEML
jgi:WD40 repeat protein